MCTSDAAIARIAGVAAANQGNQIGKIVAHDRHASRAQILMRGGHALVGNVLHLDASRDFKQLAAQVVRRAIAAAGVTELIRLRFRQRDQFLQALHRQAGMHRDDVGRHRCVGDRYEILLRAVGQLFVQPLIYGENRRGDYQQRMAIRFRFGDDRRANGATCAGPVVDDYLRPKRARQYWRDEPRQDVRGAARRKRHHDSDGP